MHCRINILGVNVSDINPNIAKQEIVEWINSANRQYVCVAPVSTIVDANSMPDYCAIVNKAGMITPDGMPVVWLLKAKGSLIAARTYGPDLMLTMCQDGVKSNLKHFFYGGNSTTLQLLEKQLRKEAPGINIVGMHAPDFKPNAAVVTTDIKLKINEAKPDILWVGLGSPKQDFWMSLNRPILDVPVMVGVGAAFDFIAGIKPQAPRWMRGIGLEWLFRLCCEPKRLAKRYFIGNSLFIFYLVRRLITNAGRL